MLFDVGIHNAGCAKNAWSTGFLYSGFIGSLKAPETKYVKYKIGQKVHEN